jgi:SDR family mycofactocin-dependent oxidoreductase
VCETIPVTASHYAGPTEDDLAETVRQVEALDRRVFARKVDVRDYSALKSALDDGVAELGRLDTVVANAGVFANGKLAHDLPEDDWQTVIDINQTGVWHTCKAAIPHLIAHGPGGSIALTSSTMGLKGSYGLAHYVSSKHGVVGIMRALAIELAPHLIRVNSVHPTTVATPMVQNAATYKLFLPDVEEPTQKQIEDVFATKSVLPLPWVEPIDIANAVLFLASDEARYITGLEMKVDLGSCLL